MKNETDENLVFNSENCRAKARDTEELVDCLAIKQAGICRFSLLFGNGYFCTHPERSEIIAKTQNLNIRHDSESEGSTSSEG